MNINSPQVYRHIFTKSSYFFFSVFLQSGEYLRLKVLDIQPELTKLGVSPEEAKELLNAHDEVLLRLQVNIRKRRVRDSLSRD